MGCFLFFLFFFFVAPRVLFFDKAPGVFASAVSFCTRGRGAERRGRGEVPLGGIFCSGICALAAGLPVWLAVWRMCLAEAWGIILARILGAAPLRRRKAALELLGLWGAFVAWGAPSGFGAAGAAAVLATTLPALHAAGCRALNAQPSAPRAARRRSPDLLNTASLAIQATTWARVVGAARLLLAGILGISAALHCALAASAVLRRPRRRRLPRGDYSVRARGRRGCGSCDLWRSSERRVVFCKECNIPPPPCGGCAGPPGCVARVGSKRTSSSPPKGGCARFGEADARAHTWRKNGEKFPVAPEGEHAGPPGCDARVDPKRTSSSPPKGGCARFGKADARVRACWENGEKVSLAPERGRTGPRGRQPPSSHTAGRVAWKDICMESSSWPTQGCAAGAQTDKFHTPPAGEHWRPEDCDARGNHGDGDGRHMRATRFFGVFSAALRHLRFLLLMRAGDVESNPGPTASAAAPRVPGGMCLRDAEAFFRVFPESANFSLTILDKDRERSRGHFASISRCEIISMLPRFLQAAEGGHLFSRPLLPNVVLIDLDRCAPSAANDVYRLRPRLVTQTSVVDGVRNMQAWYVLDGRGNKGRQAAMVARALQQALGGDPKSTAPQQQGRVAGSKNCKPALQPAQTVAILHQDPTAFLSEDVFLDVCPEPRLSLLDGAVRVAPQPPPRGRPTAADEAALTQGRASETDTSGSGRDWASAMSFFERNPEASVPSAIASIHWVAKRANMSYYQKATCEKALRVARARSSAAPIQDSSPPRPDKSEERRLPGTPRRVARSIDMLREVGDPSRPPPSYRELVDAIIGLGDVVAGLVAKMQGDDSRPPARSGGALADTRSLLQAVAPRGDEDVDAPIPPGRPIQIEDAASNGAFTGKQRSPEKERAEGSPHPLGSARERPDGQTGREDPRVAAPQIWDSRRLQKTCAKCGLERPRAEFSANQWSRPTRIGSKCKICATAAKEITHKACAQCGVGKEREEFSANQWEKSAEEGSTCAGCLAAPKEPARRICAACGEEKPINMFSMEQRARSAQDGWRCRPCADARASRPAQPATQNPGKAPQSNQTQKLCTACGLLGNVEDFSRNQWGKKPGDSRRCTRCTPVSDAEVKKRCAVCGALGAEGDFSLKQWSTKGPDTRKCNLCSLPPAPAMEKVCTVCGGAGGRDTFPAAQWIRGAGRPRKCHRCAPIPPPENQKECAACGLLQDENCFSLKQWAKKLGEPRKCNR